MGNEQTKESGKSDKGGARVVIVSPSASENLDPNAIPRIKFRGDRSKHVTFTKRPQMVEVGQLPKELVHNGRIKYQRSHTRTVGISDTGDDKLASMTSVNTVASSAPGAPIIETYRQPEEDEFRWEERPVRQRALTKVDEI